MYNCYTSSGVVEYFQCTWTQILRIYVITKALFVTEWNDMDVFWCAVSVWHHKEILTLTTDAEQSVYTIICFHVVQWLGGLQYGLISLQPLSQMESCVAWLYRPPDSRDKSQHSIIQCCFPFHAALLLTNKVMGASV